MQKFLQIVNVNQNGGTTVYHPETNADFVRSGSEFKVPAILNINDWIRKSSEVESARKGKESLKDKIDEIDGKLEAQSLLNAIKTVDGAGSGLDADRIDGKEINDALINDMSIWTSVKTKTELDKKVDKTDISTTSAANKILRLNDQGLLPASITGNAVTANRLLNPRTINLTGDVTGSFEFNGSSNVSFDVEVKDNSHSHSSLSSAREDGVLLENTNSGSAASFVVNGEVVAKVLEDGTYSGSATSINNISVDNLSENNSLWTSDKIISSIENELMQYTVIDDDLVTVGPIKIFSRELDVEPGAVQTELIINSELMGAKTLMESYIVISEDTSLSCVKDINEVNGTIILKFNKQVSQATKLKCYLMTI